MIFVDRVAIGLIALVALGTVITYQVGWLEHHDPQQQPVAQTVQPNPATPTTPSWTDLDAALTSGSPQPKPAVPADILYYVEELTFALVLPIWLVLRILDFVFSGRVRLGVRRS